MIPLTHSFELISYESAVSVGPAVPEELPRVTHLANFIEVQTRVTVKIDLANAYVLFLSDAGRH